MKKLIALLLAFSLAIGVGSIFVGCGEEPDPDTITAITLKLNQSDIDAGYEIVLAADGWLDLNNSEVKTMEDLQEELGKLKVGYAISKRNPELPATANNPRQLVCRIFGTFAVESGKTLETSLKVFGRYSNCDVSKLNFKLGAENKNGELKKGTLETYVYYDTDMQTNEANENLTVANFDGFGEEQTLNISGIKEDTTLTISGFGEFDVLDRDWNLNFHTWDSDFNSDNYVLDRDVSWLAGVKGNCKADALGFNIAENYETLTETRQESFRLNNNSGKTAVHKYAAIDVANAQPGFNPPWAFFTDNGTWQLTPGAYSGYIVVIGENQETEFFSLVYYPKYGIFTFSAEPGYVSYFLYVPSPVTFKAN